MNTTEALVECVPGIDSKLESPEIETNRMQAVTDIALAQFEVEFVQPIPTDRDFEMLALLFDGLLHTPRELKSIQTEGSANSRRLAYQRLLGKLSLWPETSSALEWENKDKPWFTTIRLNPKYLKCEEGKFFESRSDREGITYNKFEQIAIQYILDRQGEKVAPAELKELMEGGRSAKNMAVARLIQKMKRDPNLGRALQQEGFSQAKRYWFDSESVSDATKDDFVDEDLVAMNNENQIFDHRTPEVQSSLREKASRLSHVFAGHHSADMSKGSLSKLQLIKASGHCKGGDTDDFFPDRGASLEAAREVCKACVVREECLEYALEANEKFGVWGGMSERQRRKIRQERARALVLTS